MNKLAFDNLTAKFPTSYEGAVPRDADDAAQPARSRPADAPAFDIDSARARFQAHSFATQRDIGMCLASVHAECAKVVTMSLFNTNLTKSVRLDEFQLMQTQAADYVNGYLKNTWGVACRTAVTSGLQGVGKGWFNMAETSQEVYDMSKLKKFMRMVKHIMQDALYSLVKVCLFDCFFVLCVLNV